MTANNNNEMHQDHIDANTVVEIATPTILFLRLGCGDDIICHAVYLDGEIQGKWYIADPVVVVMNIDPELQKQTLLMYPWLPRGVVDTNDALLNEDEVILVKKVDKDIEEYYKELCIEIFTTKPKIVDSDKKKVSELGKNVFAFDPRAMRPRVNNENQKANTN